jgi:hypothetical protein
MQFPGAEFIARESARTVNPVQTTAFLGVKKGACWDGVDGGNLWCWWIRFITSRLAGGLPLSNFFDGTTGVFSGFTIASCLDSRI